MMKYPGWIGTQGYITLLIVCLSACTSITPSSSPPATSWKDRQVSLSRIQHWQLNGKVGVQTTRELGSANVDWIQKYNQYTVSLFGPLGMVRFKLTGQANRVTLETADGKRYTANNPEQLLVEQWGFRLPISSLIYWIRGLPVSGMTYTKQLDTYNRLSELVQQGWRIQFLSYVNVGGIDLPNKITITSSILKVKLIIYRWDITKPIIFVDTVYLSQQK